VSTPGAAKALGQRGREFWRFVLVQQRVAELVGTAIAFPPMQRPASFNLQAVKEQIEEAIAACRRGR
jgi:hypothetical protein